MANRSEIRNPHDAIALARDGAPTLYAFRTMTVAENIILGPSRDDCQPDLDKATTDILALSMN